MYSKSLVFAQFFLITVMVVFSGGIFNSGWGLSVSALGAVVGLWTMRHNRLGNFNIRPVLKEACILITSGPYRWVRHPMYTSVLLMSMGLVVANPISLEIVLFMFLTLVLLLKSVKEERLWCANSTRYQRYMEGTKRFIPYLL